MADQKISQLANATTPLAGTEVLPVVQSGATKNVSVANLTAGRVVSIAGFTAYKSATSISTIESGTTAAALSTKNNSRNWATGVGYLTGGAEYDIVDVTAGAGRFQIDTGGNVKVTSGNLVVGANGKGISFAGNGSVIWRCGAGTPEGAVTAPVGSLYTRTDGGANTTLYVKESGTGNTGWVAK